MRPDDVGGKAAWQALCLAGFLTIVWGDSAVCTRSPLRPEDRALALSPYVLPRTVVGRHTALWVYTNMRRSTRVHLLYSPTQHRPTPAPEHATHQAVLLDGDVQCLAGIDITSPARTAIDLCVHLARPLAIEGLRALLASEAVQSSEIRARIAQMPPRSRSSEAADIVNAALGIERSLTLADELL